MKTILTALTLLAATLTFAEDAPKSVSPATNSVVNTNEPSGYKPRKTTATTDAYTGATRRARKQK